MLVLKEIEPLSDAQAAEAVRARMDGNYALAVDLDDPGFDDAIWTDFRARLLAHGAEARLLTRLRDTLAAAGMLKARGRQRTDSPPVLANIRTLTRLTLVAETMRHALNDLATVAPAGLRPQIAPTWRDRYAVRVAEYRRPTEAPARQALVQAIGQEGFARLPALQAPTTPPDLGQRPAIQTRRAVWSQQYYGPHDLRGRVDADLPPHAPLITSP